MQIKPHLTAIARRSPSKPAQKLDSLGLLAGRKLDYGCGRGMDAETYDMERYDPYYQPNMPDGQFDTITCTFVLNVIPDERERNDVIDNIRKKLTPDGRAYITVRRDTRALNGVTSRGTWQGLIELDYPIIASGTGFVTYEVTK